MSFDERQWGLASFGPASAFAAAGGVGGVGVCAKAAEDNKVAARMLPARASFDIEVSSEGLKSRENIGLRNLFLPRCPLLPDLLTIATHAAARFVPELPR